MRDYRYATVDVFTEQPLEGNALAVFPGAGGLDDRTTQRIARRRSSPEVVEPELCARKIRVGATAITRL
jgi:predicted PhzF superfamily epimerase YddE/YHI9